jgi:hypothetical protein
MMKTSCRLVVFLLLACPLPLAAQGVFVVTDVREDGVVVSPVDSGAKRLSDITKGFARFDLFDVYAARSADSLLTDFVDSLYYDSTTQDGVLLRFVWKGENKFLKRGFFAVRTGRVYMTGGDETVSKATVKSNPLTDSSTIKGSFGVPGLAIMGGIGLGAREALNSSAGFSLAAEASTRVWFRFIGISLRACLPVEQGFDLENLSTCALLDFGYTIFPFWAVFASVGASLSGQNAGIASAAGTFFLLPLFGAGKAFMPYLELTAVVPNVLNTNVDPYGMVILGFKL